MPCFKFLNLSQMVIDKVDQHWAPSVLHLRVLTHHGFRRCIVHHHILAKPPFTTLSFGSLQEIPTNDVKGTLRTRHHARVDDSTPRSWDRADAPGVGFHRVDLWILVNDETSFDSVQSSDDEYLRVAILHHFAATGTKPAMWSEWVLKRWQFLTWMIFGSLQRKSNTDLGWIVSAFLSNLLLFHVSK